jgi:predicted nucleic acid-binding protein
MPGRVPDLTQFPWIEVSVISEVEIASVGAHLVGHRRSSQRYRWLNRQVDRPEIEAVILGKRVSGRVVIEDANAVKCATDVGVSVVNVAGLLIELERERHIADAKACATAIMATGYYSKELRWLSWRRS